MAEGLECPVEINRGSSFVVLTSYYGHSVGQGLYSDVESQWITGPGWMFASSEGHPVGHTWLANNVVLSECGITPNTVFVDGFESGDLSSWD